MSVQPRFVDLQVNGYAGVDFNQDDLSEVDLRRACQLLREDGVAGILATVITDDLERMATRLKRIAAIRQANPLVREVIWGFHIEGPFLNETPGYVGAHPPQFVRPANVDQMQCLLEAADGLTRLVTLAPERDLGMKLISRLSQQGIIVSAGHSDASLDQLRAAVDAGLSMFTHLANGCPALMDRHDNIIQRALSLHERLTLCFIADGVHIPPWVLENYLRLAGIERSVVVTDAMSAARLGAGEYTIGSQTIKIGDDLVARAPGRSCLAGSTATMPRMAAILQDAIGLSAAETDRLLCHNPRAVLEGQAVA